MRDYIHKGVTCFITKTAPDPVHVTGVGSNEHFWRGVAFNISALIRTEYTLVCVVGFF